MTASIRLRTGDTEPIEVFITDNAGTPLIGLTNINIKIRRLSDDFYYDWSDDTFKTSGSVVQILENLIQVDLTNNPGMYKLSSAGHPSGFDTSLIFNPVVDDTYRIIATQDGAPQSAGNVPQLGEIKIGNVFDERTPILF